MIKFIEGYPFLEDESEASEALPTLTEKELMAGFCLMPFGKWRGHELSSISLLQPEYLVWMATTDIPDRMSDSFRETLGLLIERNSAQWPAA